METVHLFEAGNCVSNSSFKWLKNMTGWRSANRGAIFAIFIDSVSECYSKQTTPSGGSEAHALTDGIFHTVFGAGLGRGSGWLIFVGVDAAQGGVLLIPRRSIPPSAGTNCSGDRDEWGSPASPVLPPVPSHCPPDCGHLWSRVPGPADLGLLASPLCDLAASGCLCGPDKSFGNSPSLLPEYITNHMSFGCRIHE